MTAITELPRTWPTDRAKKERFLASLSREALSHPALNHPWLATIANSGFGDMHWALRDFAREYYGYSRDFPSYLRAVIDRLESPLHQELLGRNLEEEQGDLDDADREALRQIGIDPTTVDGVSHPQLFRRFCRAIGVSTPELQTSSDAALRWRERFSRFLNNATPAAAVGALGMGTEEIVKHIYQPMLAGIRGLGLKREDYVFFELHCLVDDQHALDLRNVATDLLRDGQNCNEMRLGMKEALNLRNEFWDHLHRRANSVLRMASA